VKLTGNCLRGSRPILSFDKQFDETPAYRLLKLLLTQVFGSPKAHPRVKPFVDHVFCFFLADHRIWFRNYQIVYQIEDKQKKKDDPVLVEIGPRFVLNPIRIFQGSFSGETIWENREYRSPSDVRGSLLTLKANQYKNRIDQKRETKKLNRVKQIPGGILDSVFDDLSAVNKEEDKDEAEAVAKAKGTEGQSAQGHEINGKGHDHDQEDDGDREDDSDIDDDMNKLLNDALGQSNATAHKNKAGANTANKKEADAITDQQQTKRRKRKRKQTSQ